MQYLTWHLAMSGVRSRQPENVRCSPAPWTWGTTQFALWWCPDPFMHPPLSSFLCWPVLARKGQAPARIAF